MAGQLEFSLPDWVGLAARYPEPIVLAVRLDFERGGNPAFEPRRISPDDPAVAGRLLRELGAPGGGGPWLGYDPRYRCDRCDSALSPADRDCRICPDNQCSTNTDGEAWAEREEPVWRLVDPDSSRVVSLKINCLSALGSRGRVIQ